MSESSNPAERTLGRRGIVSAAQSTGPSDPPKLDPTLGDCNGPAETTASSQRSAVDGGSSQPHATLPAAVEHKTLGKHCVAVIATYNERENLPVLVARLHHLYPSMSILVIDDNSPDGTGGWAETFAQENMWFTLISRSGKMGLGSATLAGFRWAMQKNFQRVMTMDADLSHDPDDAGRLLERSEQWAAGMTDAAAPSPSHPLASASNSGPASHIVIGSRYVAGGKIEGWPWRRRWASWSVNRFARIWLRLPAKDNSGAFRCYSIQTLKQLELDNIANQGYGYLEEILFLAMRQGVSIHEVPITFRDRTAGQSKVSVREAISAVWSLFRIGFRWRFF